VLFEKSPHGNLTLPPGVEVNGLINCYGYYDVSNELGRNNYFVTNIYITNAKKHYGYLEVKDNQWPDEKAFILPAIPVSDTTCRYIFERCLNSTHQFLFDMLYVGEFTRIAFETKKM
jgi:hypothetical protein